MPFQIIRNLLPDQGLLNPQQQGLGLGQGEADRFNPRHYPFEAGHFLHGLARGWPLERCLAFGNAAAAIYVSRLADRFPDADEAEAMAARLLPPGTRPTRTAAGSAGR